MSWWVLSTPLLESKRISPLGGKMVEAILAAWNGFVSIFDRVAGWFEKTPEEKKQGDRQDLAEQERIKRETGRPAKWD